MDGYLFISRTPWDTFLRILTTEVVMGRPWVQFIARESSWHSGWLVGDNLRMMAISICVWICFYGMLEVTYIRIVLKIFHLGGGLLLQEEKERILLFSFWRNGNLEEQKPNVSNWEEKTCRLSTFEGQPQCDTCELRERDLCHLLFLLWHFVVEVEIESRDVHVKVFIIRKVVLDR